MGSAPGRVANAVQEIIFSISDIRFCPEAVSLVFFVSTGVPPTFPGFRQCHWIQLVLKTSKNRSVFRVAIWLNELGSPGSNQAEMKVKVCNHPEASPVQYNSWYVVCICINYLILSTDGRGSKFEVRIKG